jgi:hypothetical protein
MEIRRRLIKFPIGPIALAAIGAVVLLALTLFVLATLSRLPRTTRPSTLVEPAVVTSPEDPGNPPKLTK